MEFFNNMLGTYGKCSIRYSLVYLDFQKVFDKAPHIISLAKLRILGIIDEVKILDRRLDS